MEKYCLHEIPYLQIYEIMVKNVNKVAHHNKNLYVYRSSIIACRSCLRFSVWETKRSCFSEGRKSKCDLLEVIIKCYPYQDDILHKDNLSGSLSINY